ncbi:MAG: SusE domain-containing protein, partial [Alistipes sp.]|nr:SusE domain-containing protein [Alistipes sp.]
SCSDDKTDTYPDKGWGELAAPHLTVSAEETVLDKASADVEALRFEWTSADDGNAAAEYDFYMNIDGRDIFAGYKRQTGGERIVSFTAAELNDLLASQFGARSGERFELRACVHARADDMLIEDKTSNEVLFAVTAYEAEIVRPEALYMKGGACPDGWDGAVELQRGDDGQYSAAGVELRFGKPADNKGFKFYVEPDGSYPFYGQTPGGEFGEMSIFASENDGDSQFYPLQHGCASGVYTVTADLDAMRLTLDRTGDVEEFDPDAVLYILGDGMEYGWDMVEQNALLATGDGTFEIAEIRLKAESSFKFYYHDWTEFIRDGAAADYWTAKRKGDGDGDIRFVPAEAGLGAGTYKVSVDLTAMRVQLTLMGAEPAYPEQLFIFGPATEAGWDLGSFIPMTAAGNGSYRAEGVRIDVGTANPDDIKGNGFKFGVSNSDWSTEYGAAGSFDDGYRGWGLVQGSDQFYP